MGINTEFYRKDKDPDMVISENNRVVDGYIRAIGQEVCDEALKFDSRGNVKHHLGSERRSVVAWYPFKEGCKILEIGGEFGALTGELCDKAAKVIVTEPSLFRVMSIAERYKKRDNLEIYAGDVLDMEFSGQFDYIVIIDIVNKIGNHAVGESAYIKALTRLKKFLAEDGKLLLADENLYSLQRCQQEKGALNPTSHLRLLYKNQISNILMSAGFDNFQFFYPLPGYRIVGRIYSDKRLPTAVEWNCLANYSNENQNVLATNMDLMSRLTENGMFPHLAPAFIVEAGRCDNLCDIETANVLFDENYELPYLGFDWKQHGYKSLAHAIDTYRLKTGGTSRIPDFELQQKYLKSRVYKIDQDSGVLEEVLDVELELLKKLKQVCDKHGLKLYAMYGTLLGAVRSAGIIPGDDDIDVALTREDYNKLLLLEGEFKDQYFLQTPANDECFYGGYLKLRNKNTTAIHPQNWWTNCCEGIAIDIFPLDSGYADAEKEKRKRRKIKHLQRLLYAKSYGYFPNFKDMKLLKWKCYKYISKLFTRENLANRLTCALAESDGDKAAPFGIYAQYRDKGQPKLLDRTAFKQIAKLHYEGIELCAPSGWDKILRMLYGDSYMQPKAWQEGKIRHGFYDVANPYQVNKERFKGLLKQGNLEKPIILFGDGYLYKDYFQKYGNQYVPVAIVSLREGIFEKQIHGIQVMTIEEFLRLENREIYPIICALDIREAQKQLEAIGVKNYHIFLKKREWMLLANYTFALSEVVKK